MQLGWATRVASKLEPNPYGRDPVSWASGRAGIHLWSKQREIMELLLENRRVAVRSAHGIGKSFTAAVTTAWWLDVHPPGEAMVVSTAPSREQVHSILWEEIRKLHRENNLRGVVQRADRWLLEDGTLIGMGRRPPDHAQSAFQGIHRKYVLVVMDEAGGIPAWLWEAVKTITTSPFCRVLAIGNPDDNSSEFARVSYRDPTWKSIKISAFDSPNLTGEKVPEQLKHNLVSREWVEDVRLSWGEQNPLYIAKVLGEFADSEDGLIPLSWVTAAQRRWDSWHEAGAFEQPGRRIIGCDVARYGTDQTAILTREADVIRDVERHVKEDTVQTAQRVRAKLLHPKSQAIVDVIGVGAGVVDMLRHERASVVAFNAAERTGRRDATGTWKFPNKRSAAWWNLRELLDPSKQARMAIPRDDALVADLTTPGWTIGTGNHIIVESKDGIRKRIGRSPDAGDAACMAFWVPGGGGGGSLDPETAHQRQPSRRARGYSHAGGGWGFGD